MMADRDFIVGLSVFLPVYNPSIAGGTSYAAMLASRYRALQIITGGPQEKTGSGKPHARAPEGAGRMTGLVEHDPARSPPSLRRSGLPCVPKRTHPDARLGHKRKMPIVA